MCPRSQRGSFFPFPRPPFGPRKNLRLLVCGRECWFDAEKCARGIDALKLYRAQYDDKLQALRPRPVHDWTSHAADSFRYLALTLDRKATHSGFYRRIEYTQQGVV
jgi:hypothetical protein